MDEKNKKFNRREYGLTIKKFARDNRKNATDAENIMWYALRNCGGYRFRRQFQINNKYIVDFICIKKKLIIELDGGQHNENRQDFERTKYLEELGFRVIRFWNSDVLKKMDVCLMVVYDGLTT